MFQDAAEDIGRLTNKNEELENELKDVKHRLAHTENLLRDAGMANHQYFLQQQEHH